MCEQRLAPAAGALDVLPHGPVLRPPHALGIARRSHAERRRATVKAACDRARGAVVRRRARRQDAGAREVADDRSDGVVIAALGGEPRELGQRDVVAAVDPGPVEPLADALDRFELDVRALDEEHVQTLVALLGEQQAARRAPVTSRAAGLLVVGLERARDRRVADGPHVGLVDAHPERVGGDDHLRLAGHEALLGRRPRAAVHAGVVDDRPRLDGAGQRSGEPLGRIPRAGVDDRRQGIGLGQRRGEAPLLVERAPARDDREAQVGAIEAGRHANRIA